MKQKIDLIFMYSSWDTNVYSIMMAAMAFHRELREGQWGEEKVEGWGGGLAMTSKVGRMHMYLKSK